MRSRTCFISILASLFFALPARPQVPQAVTYSGFLQQNGIPFDGTATALFQLFDDPLAGSEVWSKIEATLPVVEGSLVVDLDTPSILFTGSPLWLSVTVNGQVLAPRLTVNTVPYAFKSANADDATTLGGLGTSDVALNADLAAHNHVGGNGAQVQHGDLGGIAVDDHHTPTTDTNAQTICDSGEYLDGDGSCVSIGLPALSCGVGNVVTWDAAGSQFVCTPDIDTFVTNKNTHDHAGGDGAQIQHGDLGSITANAHHSPTINTDAETRCDTGEFLDGDGNCVVLGSVPTGAVMFFDLASCPIGWTVLASARGRYVLGAPAAGTVGGTLGTAATADLQNASFTPSGNVSAPVFTGTPVGSHGHSLANSGGTIPNVGNGTAVGIRNSVTALIVGPSTSGSGTFQGVARTTNSVGGHTPAGTVSAPTFTGTANSTMRSAIAPFVQLLPCRKN